MSQASLYLRYLYRKREWVVLYCVYRDILFVQPGRTKIRINVILNKKNIELQTTVKKISSVKEG